MSELKRLIAEGESVQLDFKFRIDDQKKIARTLSGFANTKGGKLLIGVKNNGKINGVNPEEEFYMIEGAAGMYCKPEVKFESKVWQEGHHLVLEVLVPQSDEKHLSKTDDDKWKYYVRVDDHTLLANKIIVKGWKLAKFGVDKPVEFDEDTERLIETVRREEPVTLSKLYRKSGLPMRRVDDLLTNLVYWDVVGMEMDETGTRYKISEENSATF